MGAGGGEEEWLLLPLPIVFDLSRFEDRLFDRNELDLLKGVTGSLLFSIDNCLLIRPIVLCMLS